MPQFNSTQEAQAYAARFNREAEKLRGFHNPAQVTDEVRTDITRMVYRFQAEYLNGVGPATSALEITNKWWDLPAHERGN